MDIINSFKATYDVLNTDGTTIADKDWILSRSYLYGKSDWH